MPDRKDEESQKADNPTVDYSNAKKTKKSSEKPAKNITSVVEKPVVVQKRSIGTKIKELFVAADFKTVLRYVGYDVLIPAARNMIVDSATKGVERLMYGEARRRGVLGHGSRMVYNSPISREREGWRDPRTNPPSQLSRERIPRSGRRDILITNRQDAETVLDEMFNLLSVYEVVSVSDLNELLGLTSTHVDEKWGWTSLAGSDIRQARNGFYIDLPPEEPIT